MKIVLTIVCACLLTIPLRASEEDVTLNNFKLTGNLTSDGAAFVLTATAHVANRQGDSLTLLAGPVALTAFEAHPHEHIHAGRNEFTLQFDHGGDFPVRVEFTAAVRQVDGWNKVEFGVAASVLQPIVLRGLAAETQFQFTGAARPERQGENFVSYLPSDGSVKLSWKEVRAESEGKLFFSAGMVSQVSVSPGLIRQVALMDFKVMQGELNRVTLRLRGAGEVTRVQGDQVLAWNVEPLTNSTDRRLVIQLNQPQKDGFGFQVQAQTPLGAFPQTADLLQLRPENATRFAGYLRLVNEGAVRLEVLQASGTSQISPDQFPVDDATRAAFHVEGNQVFAYRFAGADFALRIQADQILPALAVSETLAYHAGENELAVDADLELEISDAPLRELMIDVPRGFAVARLNAAGMNDYFLTDAPEHDRAELRLVYGQPVSGRQLVQLRLEKNQGLTGTEWTLPRVDVAQAKSVRGYVGAAADAGLRLTPARTKSLTDIATAYYPGKVDGLQAAFRLGDPAWEAALHVERLPQTVQASALHLFSIGEGIAYGSSVINYVITGAPVSTFRVGLSDEYYNVEFSGKDLRPNWQKTNGGYVVQVQTPVSGAYTLLATYERPFKPQGETLGFTGAQPIDAQSEEGYTLVTSDYQFDVKPADVSPGLLRLEPGEVPPQFRLFFDAPVLRAYRYAARPFNLKLSLSPLAQGNSLNQIVDRASLVTHISKEGQVLTDVRYFIKNRGNPHFRLTVPDGTQLWAATVNGQQAVPVKDGKASLIPLPQNGDPNAVLQLDLKLATQSASAGRVRIDAPADDAPVMLAEWKMEPDAGQRLVYDSGSVMPVGGVPDISGFAQFARLFNGPNAGMALGWLFAALALAGGAAIVWRWALRDAVFRGGAAAVISIFLLVTVCVWEMASLAATTTVTIPTSLTFLAPVQQEGGALSVTVSNIADKITPWMVLHFGWPILAAAAVWLVMRNVLVSFGRIAGWLVLAWGTLRFPNSAVAACCLLLTFLLLRLVVPALVRVWRLPRGSALRAAPAATALLAGGLFLVGFNARASDLKAVQPVMPENVTQDIRVEGKFALATAKIRWQAARGDVLPLLAQPAVLTHVAYPPRVLELQAGPNNSRYTQQLLARSAGLYDIEVQYQMPVSNEKSSPGFALPVPYGLINRLNLTVVDADVDVVSSQAVSAHCDHATTNTVATLVLSPAEATVAWRPRRRDVAHEKPVFYAEVAQLYVPAAGVIEGAHYVSIRPAQGELSELLLHVPRGATVTDVLDPIHKGANASLVSLWRFDPDTGRLRVTLNPPQSRTFLILVRSQIAAGPLPFEQSAGLVAVENSDGQQIGMAGIATGGEVQLDSATPHGLSPINLEDFPADTVTALQGQIPGLALRRAFRYEDTNATVSLRAAAVEPDVRVQSEDTLSLGEDRTVLADNFTADITRAGVFELSFVLPDGFDLESISSPVLNQWTELKTDSGRVITLHLAGKTLGRQTFNLTLTGPGVKTAGAWKVPQVVLRQAAKQQGTLLIVPEQGMRLQVGAREGYTQLDPHAAGITQKGVLGFRVLQSPATLALDIEQVDPWIQVTGLQHAAVSDSQIKVTANLQYQIENTGLKTFRLILPMEAQGVRFQGDQVTDFTAGASMDGGTLWNVKLSRRVIGQYLLQADYQVPVAHGAAKTILGSVQALDANVQRGFVTVQSDPRLEVTPDPLPESLQAAEWQGIPHVLQKDLQAAAASYTWRMVGPFNNLPLKLERHEAAKLLPANVKSITFHSVISDDAVMLTRTELQIVPGDERLLSVTLPAKARFWFAFVNDSGVWPWRDGDKILIPLQQQSAGNKPVTVEIFHSCSAGQAEGNSLDLALLAPKFDLPLENITWKVSLGARWRVKHWDGSLQLQEQRVTARTDASDTQSYLQNEGSLQQARTVEAEQFMALGNSSLANGDPQQARRAFEAACGLSTADAAFNEDARVQLHNVRLQQALVGLNSSQSAVAGDPGALGGKLRDLRNRKVMNYSQQDAQDIIDVNTAEENANFVRLAEKLIQQQDAVLSAPAAIRASIPDEGRELTFTRSVAVNASADLRIGLQASADRTTPIAPRALALGGALIVFGIFRPKRRAEETVVSQ